MPIFLNIFSYNMKSFVVKKLIGKKSPGKPQGWLPRMRTRMFPGPAQSSLSLCPKHPLPCLPVQQGWGRAERSRILFTLPDRIAFPTSPEFSKYSLGRAFAAGQEGGGK